MCCLYLDYLRLCVLIHYLLITIVNVMLSLPSVMSPPTCRPIGAKDSKVIYFGSFCFSGELGFLNCDDICMCVVNKQFEFPWFIFISVYFTSITRFLSLVLLALCACVVHVVIWLFLVCLVCMGCEYAVRVREYEGGNAGVGDGEMWLRGMSIWVLHVVQVLCLVRMTCWR